MIHSGIRVSSEMEAVCVDLDFTDATCSRNDSFQHVLTNIGCRVSVYGYRRIEILDVVIDTVGRSHRLCPRCLSGC